jgi:autotransporter-associated beta strand protein
MRKHTSRAVIGLACLALVILAFCGSAGAGTTWDGGGTNDNWSTPANWSPDGVPPNDGTATLSMAGSVRPLPIVDVIWYINMLMFSPGAAPFSLSGGPGLVVYDGGIRNMSANLQRVNCTVGLGANTYFDAYVGPLSVGGDIDMANKVLTVWGSYTTTLSGQMFGNGSLTKKEGGTLALSGSNSNSYFGATTVEAGTLELNKSGGAVAIPANLVVGASGGAPSTAVVRNWGSWQITRDEGRSVTVNRSGLWDLNDRIDEIHDLVLTAGDVRIGGPGILNVDGTITVNASDTTARIREGLLTLTGSNKVFDVASGVAAVGLDVSSRVSNGGSGDIVKRGAGTLRFSGSSPTAYMTTTYVDAGTLELAKAAGVLAIPGSLWIGDGAQPAVVRFLNAGQTSGDGTAVRVNVNGTFDLNGYSGTIVSLYTAGGSVTTGAGTLTVRGGVTSLGSSTTSTVSGALDLGGAAEYFDVDDGPAAPDLSVPATIANGSMVKTGAGTLTLGGASSLGSVTLQQGTLNAASTLTVLGGGTYSQTGGTFTGTLRSQGTFSYAAGTFAGQLINEGTFPAGPSFAASGGVQNLGTITRSAGQALTADATGLDNEGTVILAGGTLDGSGPKSNGGLISGFGRLAGGGTFVNNAQVTVSGGNLTLASALGTDNYGTIDIEAGRQLIVSGSTIGNAGAVNLNGSTVTGGLAFINLAGGTVAGHGTVASPFFNAGGLLMPDGGALSVAGGFPNSGEILLAGGAAALTGAGGIDNTGLIRGDGRISQAVTNSLGGELRAEAGKRLKFEGACGTNAALISLQGGTAEFTQPLTNGPSGAILGRGTLMVGGAGLTNNGNIGFSGGFTDVYGDVANNAGARIVTSGGGTTTFYDDVTAAGGEMRVSAGCAAVFFGSYNGGATGAGTVYAEGDLRPGHSPAAVAFEGSLVLGSSAALDIELGGTVPGTQYDTVSVGQNLTLGGLLNVALIDGFRPSHNDAFQILTWGSRTGDFAGMTGLDLGGRLRLVPAWGANNLTLKAVRGSSGSWRFDASGAASVPDNWVGGIPNGVDDRATFGSVIHAPRQVAVDAATVLGAVIFDSATLYTLAGPGTLTLQASSGHAEINITGLSGPHVILAPLKLLSPLDVDIESAAALTLAGPIDNSAGLTITKIGPGAVDFDGPQTYGPGAWLDVFDGTVNLGWGAGSASAADLSIRVTDAVLNFECNQYLDTLSIGDGGKVAFAGAHVVVLKHLVMGGIDFGATTLTPEPATLGLLVLGSLLLVRCRRRR